MQPFSEIVFNSRRISGERGNRVRQKHEVQEEAAHLHKRHKALLARISAVFAVAVALSVVCGCSSSSHNPVPPCCRGEVPAQSPPANFANYTESIPGTKVTFEMIAVPGGSFVMGSPESESGRKKEEGPQHRVTVGPFWIGMTEVTWDEFDAFLDACPPQQKGAPWMEKYVDGVTCPTLPYGDPYRGFGGGRKPAIGMSWYAAMVYCRWLSRKTGKIYRLPTEAEWEYACRAGSEGAFCFGDDTSNLGEYAWYRANSDHSPHGVGLKKPNAWGIYDMHGNVSEWCLDWFAAGHYASAPSGKWPKDPHGPDSGKNHVIRGGSWNSDVARVRSASREYSRDWWLKADPQSPPSHWWLVPTNYLGFRIVRPLRGEEPPFPALSNGL